MWINPLTTKRGGGKGASAHINITKSTFLLGERGSGGGLVSGQSQKMLLFRIRSKKELITCAHTHTQTRAHTRTHTHTHTRADTHRVSLYLFISPFLSTSLCFSLMNLSPSLCSLSFSGLVNQRQSRPLVRCCCKRQWARIATRWLGAKLASGRPTRLRRAQSCSWSPLPSHGQAAKV